VSIQDVEHDGEDVHEEDVHGEDVQEEVLEDSAEIIEAEGEHEVETTNGDDEPSANS